MKNTVLFGSVAALAFAASGAMAAEGDTLKEVKARGVLNCGVNTGLIGFAAPDDNGNWSGFDVAFCKAMAAADHDIAVGDLRSLIRSIVIRPAETANDGDLPATGTAARLEVDAVIVTRGTDRERKGGALDPTAEITQQVVPDRLEPGFRDGKRHRVVGREDGRRAID